MYIITAIFKLKLIVYCFIRDIKNLIVKVFKLKLIVSRSDDQNRPNILTISNIINWTIEYDLIGIRTKHELEFWKSKSSM